MLAPVAAITLLALAQAAADPAPAPAHGPAPLPSLLSAEPLGPASLLAASAGWSHLRLAYAQGMTSDTDLGLFSDLDYATTELRAGGTLRTPIAPLAPFDGALRLSLAWYHDSGGRWIHRTNHVDNGLELSPGVSYSRRGAGGVVSLLGDVPVTFTFAHQGGVLLNPKAAFAYEAPLYGPFAIGLQLGLGLRFGIGSAPMKNGMGEVSFLALASYRPF
ncbi:MAG TPA: hypothetical protein VMU15_09545 [Anaeromyxobacter sp.]|nr:hypothetical protein [Anaeromyxobacter sp.]